MYRILHVGLGPLGIRFVDDYQKRRFGEVIGAVDLSPQMAGRPLSEACKGASSAVIVARKLDEVKGAADADVAVVTTSSDLAVCADTFRWMLSRGMTVVTTCEEATWPWLRHEKLANELHQLAVKNKGRLLGTGVNPGFLMDAVPVFASTVCRSIKSIEVHRFQDATSRRIPFQKKIGATLNETAFKAGVKAGWLRHVGLGESIHFVAAAMGWKIDSWRETIAPVIASKPMKCGLGPIKKGDAAGVLQTAMAMCEGKRVLRYVFQAAIGQKDPHDRVVIEGEPRVDLTFNGGVHGDIATSSISINCIPSLLAAAPGLHTMASIPLVHYAPPR